MTKSPSLWLKSWRRLAAEGKAEDFSSFLSSAMPAGLRLAGAFLQLLSTILIARSLGVEDSGMYFFWAAAMLEVGQVATYGLDRLALQQVPRLDGKRDQLTRFLAPLRATALMLGVILASGLCFYAYVIQGDSQMSPFWYILPFLCIAGVVMSMINGEAMAGLGRPVLAIVCRHTMLNVTLILCIIFMGDRLTTDLAISAYALAFFTSGFGALLLPGFRGQGKAVALPSREQFRGHLVEGSPLFLGSVFASLAFIVPLAILERTHSSAEIALVTTAFRIFVLVDVLVRAIHSLVMPELSRAAHVGDGALLGRIYRTAVVKGLLVLGIPVLGIMILAEPIMAIFGEGFEAGASLLRIFMGYAFVLLLLGPAQQLLLMVGHTRRMAFFSLVSFLFSVILSFLFVPRFGPLALTCVLGAAIILERGLFLFFSLKAMYEPSRTVEGSDE
ncbi:MAG: oligosaccharide flippase family protein [Verrucomicrobiales bacterium]|nr:oligosaccharide flippase family protein [Verrucomicrobiales bacterium]